ncbi:MAG TPA: sulfatase-like hydrolase/transferase [Clostridiaceae bacterium]|nr:sulfatase-like hydrolase/transferase [Clostridiaceae bacterium]
MKSNSRKPNVLLICTDHWPGPLMGAAGHEYIMTPTLDYMCENGIRFENAYTETPTCVPARRALMTGTCAKTHGDRVFSNLPMKPELTTMAQAFRNAGYQAYAVGKLHVSPQRDRIGFDDAYINEEGRMIGQLDDYQLFIRQEGFAGEEYAHGMGQNMYTARPWHLPEYCHPTYWTTREMCKIIKRRDPTRPAFWYCSYVAPHPPLVPPRDYWDMYMNMDIDQPVMGDWAKDKDNLPYGAWYVSVNHPGPGSPKQVEIARKAFYAQCTYIDSQIRLLIGTLREENLIDSTIIMFTADHGDMLGHHGMWAKPYMYEYSAKIPMILMPLDRNLQNKVDDRLVELRDVMPTLLDMCDISIPDTVEGISMIRDKKREYLYCEHSEGENAIRMIRKEDFKLIYYPVGNRIQLFNIKEDPMELMDLSEDKSYENIINEMKQLLIKNLYGSDLEWFSDGKLVGLPEKKRECKASRHFFSQRGWR